MNRQDLLDNIRMIVREELHCIVDEQEQRLDALFHPPEHDGDLGDDASVEIREAFQDVRIQCKLGVCAMGIEQVLSLRDWLIQKSPMLEQLAKEQEHA